LFEFFVLFFSEKRMFEELTKKETNLHKNQILNLFQSDHLDVQQANPLRRNSFETHSQLNIKISNTN